MPEIVITSINASIIIRHDLLSGIPEDLSSQLIAAEIKTTKIYRTKASLQNQMGLFLFNGRTIINCLTLTKSGRVRVVSELLVLKSKLTNNQKMLLKLLGLQVVTGKIGSICDGDHYRKGDDHSRGSILYFLCEDETTDYKTQLANVASSSFSPFGWINLQESVKFNKKTFLNQLHIKKFS